MREGDAYINAHSNRSMRLTHFPDGRMVTPRMIAAANTAAFSFFPPLAACIAAADFCREAEETFFFDFLVGDFRGFFAAGL